MENSGLLLGRAYLVRWTQLPGVQPVLKPFVSRFRVLVGSAVGFQDFGMLFGANGAFNAIAGGKTRRGNAGDSRLFRSDHEAFTTRKEQEGHAKCPNQLQPAMVNLAHSIIPEIEFCSDQERAKVPKLPLDCGFFVTQ